MKTPVQQLACIALVLLISCESIAFAEDTLPSMDDVKARIQEAAALIQNLQVSEKAVRRQRDFRGGEEIYEMKRQCEWTVTADGKRHYVATGEAFRYLPKGGTTSPFKSELTFDGTYARSIRYLSSDLTRVVSGQIADHPSRYSMLPTEFTVLWGKETLLEILAKRPFSVVREADHEGRTVLVIEGEPVERDGMFWTRRIYFDMERGVPVKTAYANRKSLKVDWNEYAVWTGLDHQEIIPGVWLPLKYRKYSFNFKDDGSPKEFVDGYIGTYSNWKLNVNLPDDKFTLKYPDNIRVNDQRKGGNGNLLSKEESQELNALVK